MRSHIPESNLFNIKPEASPQILLWMLRILVPLGGIKDFIRSSGFRNDALAERLGLEEPDIAFDETQKKHLVRQIRQRHKEAEKQAGNCCSASTLHENIERLAVLLGLSNDDCQLLEFVICLDNDLLLNHVANFLGPLTSTKAVHALAVILAIPETKILESFEPKSVLGRSGLIMLTRGGTRPLYGRLDLLTRAFANQMTLDKVDPVDLLKGVVTPASDSHLALSDYPHIQADLDILMPFLRHALADGHKGVNIFVHGAPGTGKSELARTLAKALNCELFEVASEDDNGSLVEGVARLRALSAGQCIFAQRRSLIVFDEVEDVFNNGGFFGNSTAKTHKAWINRLLEENPLPTFWLSNSIRGMDAAFVRRFDMVFELPVPPRKQRQKVLHQYGRELLDDSHIARLAEEEKLAPALVAKTARVVGVISEDLGREQSMTAFTHLLSNTLEAQGHRSLKHHNINRLPDTYDPAFIHVDVDLQALLAGIRTAGSARLCLYGPPGTGKTAYGRWLAQQLDKHLLVKRASDLMSKWVGETEKNLANAFREAEQEEAVLLIDEVDSFLQDRRNTRASWEVTRVNEMLTQMEAFPGVFIASTNLVEGIDQAALRRFDLKAKFDYLRADQACELFIRSCHSLGVAQPDERTLAKIRNMPLLTPGDFATITRQHRFRPLRTANAMAEALAAECAMKEGANHYRIGFMS